ncbi:hypothetical protein F4604DRAFT_1921484 [Suillus subluteus]|nr:hypothetical protein F4604DRAFT_1921484 [Suillus subluteus]
MSHPTLMPQCPSCRKILEDHTSVACHMSQPWSGCNTWLEDIIKLNSLIPPLDPVDIEHHVSQEPELGGEAIVVDFGDVGGEFSDEENIMGGGTLDEGSEATDYYPDPSLAYQDGYTFLSLFDSDENSVHCKNNLYYLFSGQRDWQVAAWLLHSGLSMGKINSFLSLEMVKDLPLSFSSAKELRGRAEMLPSSPCWMSKIIPTSHATKLPVVLYWCNPLEPRKVYTTAEKQCRVYTEWMMGNDAWDMQVAIPSGVTLLGTILSSDKTNITALTGDHIAHPLLISLANIHMNIWLKSSSSSFVLTTLLPVPKFVHKKQMKGVLEDRLIHQCLDIILEPLKQAARHGVMLSDPIGKSCYCFTLLASYIADTPEAMMLATVGGKTLPVTMVMYKQFGDAFQHEPQMKSMTLVQLTVVCLQLFFQDWILAEPSCFFTPEDLHHIHKEFWDHDAQWLICVVGESEIEFQFSVLQPITGYQHFHGGISKLKQVTGHCHCDVQQYIIAFQYSRDEGNINAERSLANDISSTDDTMIKLAEPKPDDVLQHHHQKNGCPRLPDSQVLDLLCHAEAKPPKSKDTNIKTASAKAKESGDGPRATQLGWVVNKSKRVFGLIASTIWQNCCMRIYQHSTWRSDLKKIVASIVPSMYNLIPPSHVPPQQRAAWVEEAAMKLLEDTIFLCNGVDDNGKTENTSHPVLCEASISFFYTGSYCVARRRPEVF